VLASLLYVLVGRVMALVLVCFRSCGAQTLSQVGGGYQATCSTAGLPVGSHTLSATYTGDASYAGSSGSTNLSVTNPPESTHGNGSPNTQTGTGTKTTTSTAGSVSLAGSAITVQDGAARIKLTCTGTGTCSGKLTLTTKRTTNHGKKKHTKIQIIGTMTFSISPGKTPTIKITLNAIGRALLSAAHGHLNATLTILKTSPSPSNTQTKSVHLTLHKATKTKKGKNQSS
jgi:microcystin-dependent protein